MNVMEVNTSISSHRVKDLNAQSFEQLLKNSDKLIVVEFYQLECPFCAEIAPLYEQMSLEMPDDVVFSRIDAGSEIDLAIQFGIMATPTFKMFCRDKLVGEVVGETNATVLRNTIKDAINHQLVCSARRKRTFELDGYG